MTDPFAKLPTSISTGEGGVPPELEIKPGLPAPGAEDDEEEQGESK